MDKLMPTGGYRFDNRVKKVTSTEDKHLNLPLLAAVVFCASAWAGVAYLVIGLINH